jgi:endoplasmic reticulum-Golgi intermediate compartment protein 3
MPQPGLWVRYDFSPIMVRLVEARHGALSFAVSLCAILGGVFALSGIVDQLLYRGLQARKEK